MLYETESIPSGFSVDPLRPIVRLDGHSLSIEELEKVAKHGHGVELADEAVRRVEEGYQLLGELVSSGVPIYGVNRGVGLNKDREITREESEAFNRRLLRSHASAVGPYASEEQVRAIMTARLNSLLTGASGIQPAALFMYRNLLNAGIHPMVPLRGSVGAADISVLSHIGLTMLGEGEVMFGGELMPALQALRAADLSPIKLIQKDGLAIVSSNALSAGMGALVLGEVQRLLRTADSIFALSLEGIDGTTSPLDAATYRVRPLEGAAASAAYVLSCLQGGAIMQQSPEQKTGRIQDPLSFRSACHVHGAARDALSYTERQLLLHLNASDDNPTLDLEGRRMVPSSNFDVTSWVLAFEMLAISLSHVSKSSCYRSIKLGTPDTTGLTRFLAPNPETIAFSTMQKTYTSLDTEIRLLANPVSMDYFSLAGNIEDHATNAPLVVRKVEDIVERLTYIIGMEALHAAQAIDLRGNAHSLGKGTARIYRTIRDVVPKLTEDRVLTPDIQVIAERIRSGVMIVESELESGDEG
ncbi:aromatic amino acid lyase [Paenibacillus sp. JCM 10914]|uniref:HAL/PAL/TAL family ammonia-lyase n=1 Tax=Paenibacillus sp. JCM 10914 TaxID=1236974 RepID=UPI0003CC6EA4|nr:aromatic amino acid ammonia-lyase [Paenibacillus sp. JCM 10914]GAE06320.1 histidine ammonia-lyase [Paenibacillus sp. JCM 10914]